MCKTKFEDPGTMNKPRKLVSIMRGQNIESVMGLARNMDAIIN